MRGNLIAVGGVGSGEGEHGLFLRAYLVDRSANFGKRDLAAAKKAVEVEHHRRHPLVLSGGLECVHDVANTIFLEILTAGQRRKGVDFCRLFGNDAVELKQQRALANRERRVGAAREQAEEEREEHKEEDER